MDVAASCPLNRWFSRYWHRVARPLLPVTLIVSACLLSTCLLGCRDSARPPAQVSPTAPAEASPQQILERMFAAYRDCKTYADNAIYRERWVLRQDGVLREPPPQMVSVSLQRPARLRVTRRLPDVDGNVSQEITIVSAGDRMYHTLPGYPRQVLETAAPLELTADNFASAPEVAQRLLFLPLEDSFPQLDLLLSDEPQRGALALDPEPKLLEDALLADRPCYRVAFASNAGRRVYWIDKQSHLLLRIDLPPGHVREAHDPHDEVKQFERWIEFLDAVTDRDLPETAFQIEVPEDAVVVRKWIDGYPGPEPSGPEVTPEERELHAARLAQYDAALAAGSTGEQEFKIEVTAAEIAPKTDPKSIELTEIWRAGDLEEPGNIMTTGDGGESRLYVLDGGSAVVELDADGGRIARHEPAELEGRRASQLRTFQAADGRRWFAVSGPGLQRVKLFDEDWRHLSSFPDHGHPGIGDVVFAPFGEEGEPQLVVGFWGELGVHGVSLEGRREWADRTLQQVLGLAYVVDDPQNPLVWSVHGRDVIGRVGKDGPASPLWVHGRSLVDLAVADLDGDGQIELCGIAFVELGIYDVVGLSRGGRELWSYRLPKGEFRTPTRRVVALEGVTARGWIVPAADGSIHFIAPDGTPIDRFNYGEPVSGIAAVVHDGEPRLIVASPAGLVALQLGSTNPTE